MAARAVLDPHRPFGQTEAIADCLECRIGGHNRVQRGIEFDDREPRLCRPVWRLRCPHRPAARARCVLRAAAHDDGERDDGEEPLFY